MAEQPKGPEFAGKGDQELRQEYASAGGFGAFPTRARTLAHAFDRVTWELGAETYDEMHTDPVLHAASRNLKNHVLADDVRILPAVDEPAAGTTPDPEAEAEYKKAKEVRDYCAAQIERLQRPLNDVLAEMLEATWAGNRVAELVWEARDGDLWLTAIKPKSRRSTAFVVDAFNNVLGFFAARPGSAFLLSATFMSGDDLRKIHVVPREKFAVLTYGMRNGDPRGTSIYRPAYNAWQIKKEIIPEYYAYLQRFAGGFIWGTTAEGAKEMARRDPSTNEVLRDAAGNPITLTPQEQMNAVLLDIKNGAVGSFPFGAALHELTVPGEGGAFTSAFDVLNREMVTAVLNSPRAMLEAKNNSKADNSVGQDLLGMAVARLKRWAEAMLDKDVLWKIAYYKFGREVADQFAPRASLSDTAREDRAGMIKAYAAAGWRLTKNQWPGVSEELNLTEPDLESGYLYGSTDANVAAATDAAQSSPDDADEEEDETSEP